MNPEDDLHSPRCKTAIIFMLLEMLRSNLKDAATKSDLEELERNIMSKVSEYTDAVNAKFDEIDSQLEGIGTGITGVADDIVFVKQQLEAIQNSPGTLSPADQAALDASLVRVAGVVTKTSALKTGIAAVDAATARPTPPDEPQTS